MTPTDMRIRLATALRLRRALRLVWTAAPGWTLVNLVMVCVQGLLPLLSLLLLKLVVDALSAAVAEPAGGFVAVALWVGLSGLVALAAVLANAWGGHAAEAQGLAVTDHVADVIHAQSIAVDLGYYETPAFHDTLHQAQLEAPYRPARIVNGLKQTLQSGLLLIGIAALLFASHWAVGLALLVAALPAGLLRVVYARQRFRYELEHAATDRQSQYYHWLVTGAEHARDLRLLGVGRMFAERYSELRRQLRQGRLALGRRRTRGEMITQGVATLVLYGTLAAMAYHAVLGSLTLGVIVMYFQGYQRALAALQNLLQGLAWLYEDNLFLKHFYDFLDLPSTVEQAGGESQVPEPATQGLVCRSLDFTYPSRDKPALCGVDFEIRPGEVVALVGVNGAGKTTLAKLLCRLYDPQAGSVSWEGQDLRTLQPAAWRRQISVVSQDFARFDLTLAENIWLGDIEQPADADALLDAARIAGTDRVIAQFAGGLETRLGTHFHAGQELSIGEWQRLALARAWFRKARLLILDEPSSALDPLAEAEMIRTFREMIGRRSALIISHRLSSVQLADRIYVMAGGCMVEQGSHAELLNRNGAYARLFNAQAGHYRLQRDGQ